MTDESQTEQGAEQGTEQGTQVQAPPPAPPEKPQGPVEAVQTPPLPGPPASSPASAGTVAVLPSFNDIYSMGAQAVMNKLAEQREAQAGVADAKKRVTAARASVVPAEYAHDEALQVASAKQRETVEVVRAQQVLLGQFLTDNAQE